MKKKRLSKESASKIVAGAFALLAFGSLFAMAINSKNADAMYKVRVSDLIESVTSSEAQAAADLMRENKVQEAVNGLMETTVGVLASNGQTVSSEESEQIEQSLREMLTELNENDLLAFTDDGELTTFSKYYLTNAVSYAVESVVGDKVVEERESTLADATIMTAINADIAKLQENYNNLKGTVDKLMGKDANINNIYEQLKILSMIKNESSNSNNSTSGSTADGGTDKPADGSSESMDAILAESAKQAMDIQAIITMIETIQSEQIHYVDDSSMVETLARIEELSKEIERIKTEQGATGDSTEITIPDQDLTNLNYLTAELAALTEKVNGMDISGISSNNTAILQEIVDRKTAIKKLSEELNSRKDPTNDINNLKDSVASLEKNLQILAQGISSDNIGNVTTNDAAMKLLSEKLETVTMQLNSLKTSNSVTNATITNLRTSLTALTEIVNSNNNEKVDLSDVYTNIALIQNQILAGSGSDKEDIFAGIEGESVAEKMGTLQQGLDKSGLDLATIRAELKSEILLESEARAAEAEALKNIYDKQSSDLNVVINNLYTQISGGSGTVGDIDTSSDKDGVQSVIDAIKDLIGEGGALDSADEGTKESVSGLLEKLEELKKQLNDPNTPVSSVIVTITDIKEIISEVISKVDSDPNIDPAIKELIKNQINNITNIITSITDKINESLNTGGSGSGSGSIVDGTPDGVKSDIDKLKDLLESMLGSANDETKGSIDDLLSELGNLRDLVNTPGVSADDLKYKANAIKDKIQEVLDKIINDPGIDQSAKDAFKEQINDLLKDLESMINKVTQVESSKNDVTGSIDSIKDILDSILGSASEDTKPSIDDLLSDLDNLRDLINTPGTPNNVIKDAAESIKDKIQEVLDKINFDPNIPDSLKESLRDQVNDLLKDLNSMLDKISQVESPKENVKDSIDSIKDILESILGSASDDTKTDIDDLLSELDELRHLVTTPGVSNSAIKDKVNDIKDTLQEVLDKVNSDPNIPDSLKDALRDQVNDLLKDMETLLDKIASSGNGGGGGSGGSGGVGSGDLAGLKNEFKDAIAELESSLRADIGIHTDQTQQSVDSLVSELEDLKSQVENGGSNDYLLSKTDELQEQLKNLRDDIATSAEAEQIARDNAIRELQNLIGSGDVSDSSIFDKLGELASNFSSYKTETDQKTETISGDLADEIANRDAQHAELTGAIADRTAEVDAKLVDLNEQLIASADKSSEDLDATRNDLESAISTLGSNLSKEMSLTNSATQEKIGELKDIVIYTADSTTTGGIKTNIVDAINAESKTRADAIGDLTSVRLKDKDQIDITTEGVDNIADAITSESAIRSEVDGDLSTVRIKDKDKQDITTDGVDNLSDAITSESAIRAENDGELSTVDIRDATDTTKHTTGVDNLSDAITSESAIRAEAIGNLSALKLRDKTNSDTVSFGAMNFTDVTEALQKESDLRGVIDGDLTQVEIWDDTDNRVSTKGAIDLVSAINRESKSRSDAVGDISRLLTKDKNQQDVSSGAINVADAVYKESQKRAEIDGTLDNVKIYSQDDPDKVTTGSATLVDAINAESKTRADAVGDLKQLKLRDKNEKLTDTEVDNVAAALGEESRRRAEIDGKLDAIKIYDQTHNDGDDISHITSGSATLVEAINLESKTRSDAIGNLSDIQIEDKNGDDVTNEFNSVEEAIEAESDKRSEIDGNLSTIVILDKDKKATGYKAKNLSDTITSESAIRANSDGDLSSVRLKDATDSKIDSVTENGVDNLSNAITSESAIRSEAIGDLSSLTLKDKNNSDSASFGNSFNDVTSAISKESEIRGAVIGTMSAIDIKNATNTTGASVTPNGTNTVVDAINTESATREKAVGNLSALKLQDKNNSDTVSFGSTTYEDVTSAIRKESELRGDSIGNLSQVQINNNDGVNVTNDAISVKDAIEAESDARSKADGALKDIKIYDTTHGTVTGVAVTANGSKDLVTAINSESKNRADAIGNLDALTLQNKHSNASNQVPTDKTVADYIRTESDLRAQADGDIDSIRIYDKNHGITNVAQRKTKADNLSNAITSESAIRSEAIGDLSSVKIYNTKNKAYTTPDTSVAEMLEKESENRAAAVGTISAIAISNSTGSAVSNPNTNLADLITLESKNRADATGNLEEIKIMNSKSTDDPNTPKGNLVDAVNAESEARAKADGDLDKLNIRDATHNSASNSGNITEASDLVTAITSESALRAQAIGNLSDLTLQDKNNSDIVTFNGNTIDVKTAIEKESQLRGDSIGTMSAIYINNKTDGKDGAKTTEYDTSTVVNALNAESKTRADAIGKFDTINVHTDLAGSDSIADAIDKLDTKVGDKGDISIRDAKVPATTSGALSIVDAINKESKTRADAIGAFKTITDNTDLSDSTSVAGAIDKLDDKVGDKKDISINHANDTDADPTTTGYANVIDALNDESDHRAEAIGDLNGLKIKKKNKSDTISFGNSTGQFNDVTTAIKTESDTRADADGNVEGIVILDENQQKITYDADKKNLSDMITSESAIRSEILGSKTDLKLYNKDNSDKSVYDGSVINAITEESLRRATAIGNLGRIAITKHNSDVTGYTDYTSDPTKDIVTAINSEALQREKEIATEEARSIAAENVLGGRINAEEEARANKDSALESTIKKEISDRTTAVSKEAEARIASDGALNTALSKEATKRETEDGKLAEALSKEQSDRNDAIKDLNDNAIGSWDKLYYTDINKPANTTGVSLRKALSDESKYRLTSDNTLDDKIGKEITDRSDAITKEVGDRNTAISDAKDELTGTINTTKKGLNDDINNAKTELGNKIGDLSNIGVAATDNPATVTGYLKALKNYVDNQLTPVRNDISNIKKTEQWAYNKYVQFPAAKNAGEYYSVTVNGSDWGLTFCNATNARPESDITIVYTGAPAIALDYVIGNGSLTFKTTDISALDSERKLYISSIHVENP